MQALLFFPTDNQPEAKKPAVTDRKYELGYYINLTYTPAAVDSEECRYLNIARKATHNIGRMTFFTGLLFFFY